MHSLRPPSGMDIDSDHLRSIARAVGEGQAQGRWQLTRMLGTACTVDFSVSLRTQLIGSIWASTDMRSALLICGIVSAVTYVATDIVAAVVYPGYSFADQAVSELFAIGAPTSRIVVALFSLSSLLLGAFAVGVWMSSDHNRFLRLMAVMFGGSALVGIVLWNLFPMHMRGAEPSFTDTMHLILATNPFVLLGIVFGVAAFRDWFRLYTAATILILLLPAVFAFRYAPELQANLPTPNLGLGERMAQYTYELWQVTLAIKLLRERNSGPLRP